MGRAPGEIARRMRHVRELGLILTLAAVMVAGAKAGLAERTPVNSLQGQARENVLHVMADDEPARRVTSIRLWPSDRWSRGDAFHGLESEKARGQTALHNVALESVLDVLDADLHSRRVPGREARVPPCKPRPQYD